MTPEDDRTTRVRRTLEGVLGVPATEGNRVDPAPSRPWATSCSGRATTWTKANGGRVQLVDDDKTFYDGRPVTWDRFATWVMLRARRRRRGLGRLHPPHDQPAQLPAPARQPAADPAPAVRRRHGHPAAAAQLAGRPRPGAHRRRHEHPRLLHRPPVGGGREDEGRRLRLAQPRRRLHLLPPAPGRPARAGLGRHDGLRPPLDLRPHRHERRRPRERARARAPPDRRRRARRATPPGRRPSRRPATCSPS